MRFRLVCRGLIPMQRKSVTLREVASARSGDKGNHANIGVVAASAQAYSFLLQVLTAEYLQQHFLRLGVSRVERYELPRVWALNFVLYDALAGGASQSLRIDTQGKLLGTEVMELELPLNHTGSELLLAGGWRPMDQEPEHGTVDQDQKASAQRNDHSQSP
jgi:hypothetical protein